MKYIKLFESFNYSNLFDKLKQKYPNINRGGCGVFAKAFNKVTGYPVVLIFDTDLTEEDPPIHVVVKIDKDSYIDGESIRTEKQIRDYYNDGETGELEFIEDNQYNLLDRYYDELGEGLFSIDHKEEYNNIIDIIKKSGL